MHALSDTSGNFFPAASFFPPSLVDVLKDHTYVFNELTDNHGKPAATAGGSELPRGDLISWPHIGKAV